MKFSIITPTFRRKELLTRAVNSLLAQTYKDWEMIIVNDSPHDEEYLAFSSSINDPRIHYHVNSSNKGVNYSRNFAIDHVSADSKWILLLDDDDYFAPDTLQTFRDLILLHGDQKWFMSNRAYKNGKSMTLVPTPERAYNYAWQYLILKRLKGDATHCIETKLLLHRGIRFSKYVKQAEEWFFFYQIGITSRLFYFDHNSTITDGYDNEDGLNFRKRSKSARIESLIQLAAEASRKKFLQRPSFFLYILGKVVLTLIR